MFFLQKISIDFAERHSRPRKLSAPMSYFADHTGCRGRGDIMTTDYLITPPHPGKQTRPTTEGQRWVGSLDTLSTNFLGT